MSHRLVLSIIIWLSLVLSIRPATASEITASTGLAVSDPEVFRNDDPPDARDGDAPDAELRYAVGLEAGWTSNAARAADAEPNAFSRPQALAELVVDRRRHRVWMQYGFGAESFWADGGLGSYSQLLDGGYRFGDGLTARLDGTYKQRAGFRTHARDYRRGGGEAALGYETADIDAELGWHIEKFEARAFGHAQDFVRQRVFGTAHGSMFSLWRAQVKIQRTFSEYNHHVIERTGAGRLGWSELLRKDTAHGGSIRIDRRTGIPWYALGALNVSQSNSHGLSFVQVSAGGGIDALLPHDLYVIADLLLQHKRYSDTRAVSDFEEARLRLSGEEEDGTHTVTIRSGWLFRPDADLYLQLARRSNEGAKVSPYSENSIILGIGYNGAFMLRAR